MRPRTTGGPLDGALRYPDLFGTPAEIAITGRRRRSPSPSPSRRSRGRARARSAEPRPSRAPAAPDRAPR